MVEGLLGTLQCIPLGGVRAHRTRLKTEPVTALRRIYSNRTLLFCHLTLHTMPWVSGIQWSVATTCDLSLLLNTRALGAEDLLRIFAI